MSLRVNFVNGHWAESKWTNKISIEKHWCSKAQCPERSRRVLDTICWLRLRSAIKSLEL